MEQLPSSCSLLPRLMCTQASCAREQRWLRRRGCFRQMGSRSKLAGPRAEDEEERGEGGRASHRGRSGPLRTSMSSASAASQDEHVADQRTLGALIRKHRECGQPRDHLWISLALQRAGPHKQAARTSERLSRTSPSVSHTRSPSALALPPLDQHRRPPVTSPRNNLNPPSWPPCRPCSPRRWHSRSPWHCSSCTSACEPSSIGAHCANSQARCSPNPVDCGCSGNPCAPASTSPNAKRCSSMVCNLRNTPKHTSLCPFQTLMHRS